MSTNTYPEFLEAYAPEGRPVIHVMPGAVDIHQGGTTAGSVPIDTSEFQPFIVIHGNNGRIMILDPILGFKAGDSTPYLDVDVHGFNGHDDAPIGVMGMSAGKRFEMEGTTEKAAPGWNAARLVALFVGRFAS